MKDTSVNGLAGRQPPIERVAHGNTNVNQCRASPAARASHYAPAPDL
ncbi:MAG: hypothetical protein ACOYNR_12400 [Blastocatellia bacterium]